MVVFQEATVSVHGLTVQYYHTGSYQKPPLLLLHGLTDNGLCWTRAARNLAASYDVLMPDARGHGLTAGPSQDFSVTTLAEDAAEMIRALNLAKPVVWGHSMGAITAAFLGALYPDLVRAIILEDPPLGKSNVSARQAGQNLLPFKALSSEQRLAQIRQEQPGWDEAELEPWVESKLQFDGEIWQRFGGYNDRPWQEIIAQIHVPILLLTGNPARGALVTPEQAAEARNLWQVGELAYFPAAGHCIHRDCYAEVMQIAGSFLERSLVERSPAEKQSPGPKLLPVPLAEMDARTRELIQRANLARDGEPLHIFGTLARHPRLFASWLPFASRLLTGGSLDRRLTELVILRVAYNMGNDYEWGQHAEISANLGIEQATIARVTIGPSAGGWSPGEALVLQATDELHNERCITNATWDALSVQFDEVQLIELCFLVGQYEMLAMFLQTVGVQLEPGKETLSRHDDI